MSRQPPPPADRDLSGFPAEVLDEGRLVHRSHRPDNGPFFFNGTQAFRFNLQNEKGTCYVADDVTTAVREKLREQVFAQGVVPASLAHAFVVSIIRAGRAFRCADIGAADAVDHHVTRMLATMDDYDIPQQWAAAFDEVGFEGIRYGSSFTNGADTAWALFGDEGEHPFGDILDSLPGAAACALAGIQLYAQPHSDELETL